MTASDSRDPCEIGDGLYGWLESPRRNDAADLEFVVVSGWAFSRSSRRLDLSVRVCGESHAIPHGIQRDDVQAVYPDDAAAAASGFLTILSLEGRALGPVDLEIWARLEDGCDVQLFTRRIALPRLARILRRSLSIGRSWLHRVLEIGGLDFLNRSPARLDERNRGGHREHLERFLQSDATLRYEQCAAPRVSIVVVLWNRAELTLQCLQALAREQLPIEVVLVDNHSTDETAAILDRTSGAVVIRNTSNLGFTVAANIGARRAHGDLLLFLNNDAALAPGALEHLVRTLQSNAAIGAVGAKLIYPDGRLQEAGSVIWSDGTCDASGRNGDPAAAEYNFQRDVDYCSGAVLLTRTALFHELGGFDERFQPAYYEDVDYCVRLWETGHRVVYQPAAVAVHVQSASSSSPALARRDQHLRRPAFIAKHKEWLTAQCSRSDDLTTARTRRRGRRSVLVFDDAWPDPRLGSGFPRAAALLQALIASDYLVAFYPMNGAMAPVRPRGELEEIEIIVEYGLEGLREFLQSGRRFDAMIVSRPHNMRFVNAALGSAPGFPIPVIYDAEAVYAVREIGRRRLQGVTVPATEERALIDAEIVLARGCAGVLTVNDLERQRFVDAGVANVAVLGHALVPAPGAAPFGERSGLLFVGALPSQSPNEDAVLFLVREVLPALKAAGHCPTLTIVGARVSERVKALANDHIIVHGDVSDLTPFYDAARVFVAPTRYSAGVPLKLYEAASRGVPIVATSQLARQIGWHAGRDLIVADDAVEIGSAINRAYNDAALWKRLHEAALDRVEADCAPTLFRDRIRDLVERCANPMSAVSVVPTTRAAAQRANCR